MAHLTTCLNPPLQNFVQLAVMAIRMLIPNMATDMKERMRREAYLTSEIMIRMDLLRATGQGPCSVLSCNSKTNHMGT